MSNAKLRAALAKNLHYFMTRADAPYPNPNALATACGLSPNTIRNWLRLAQEGPGKPGSAARKGNYPQLDTLEMVAGIDAVRMVRLAVALRCSGRWLIWGAGSPCPMEALTPAEASMLEGYRQLTIGERRAIRGMIRAYLAAQQDAPPTTP